ncbi:MAG: trigger factor [Bacteroidales bacterium]|nr:trigger factor [Bacteroidales bacterium]
MNITQESKAELITSLVLNVVEADYIEEVKKSLNEYRRTANIPGFRAGKVPFGMVQKMYGEPVKADVVSKLISEQLDKYIADNNLELLGQPLPDNEKQGVINFKDDKDFTFYYELGIKPSIELELDDKTKVTRYAIQAEEETVEKYIQDILGRFGEQSNPDVVADNDMVMGMVTQLDEDGKDLKDGITKDISISLEKIKLKTIKNKFIGKKKDASVVFNMKKALKDDIEVATLLAITREEAEVLTSDFKIEIKEISRITPAELNEELYAKVYENDNIKTEEELRARVKRDVEESFKAEGDRKFYSDVTKTLIKKTDLTLPDEFLKRWIIESNLRETEDKRITTEELNSQYDSYRDTLRWQLIEEHLVKQNDLYVTQDEIKARVREILAMQAFGDQDGNDEILNQVTEQVMQNQEEIKRVSDQIIEQKMTNFFNDKLKITEKNISYDDFVAMVTKEMTAQA